MRILLVAAACAFVANTAYAQEAPSHQPTTLQLAFPGDLVVTEQEAARGDLFWGEEDTFPSAPDMRPHWQLGAEPAYPGFKLRPLQQSETLWDRFLDGEGEEILLSLVEVDLDQHSMLRLWYLETELPEIASRRPGGYSDDEAIVVQYVAVR